MSSHDFIALAFENSPRRDDDIGHREVVARAIELGMDPHEDDKLLWIARQSLKAKLPTEWVEYATDKGDIYYFNTATSESSWEHPAMNHYRTIYAKARSQRVSDCGIPTEPRMAWNDDHGTDDKGSMMDFVKECPGDNIRSEQTPLSSVYGFGQTGEADAWKMKCLKAESELDVLKDKFQSYENSQLEILSNLENEKSQLISASERVEDTLKGIICKINAQLGQEHKKLSVPTLDALLTACDDVLESYENALETASQGGAARVSELEEQACERVDELRFELGQTRRDCKRKLDQKDSELNNLETQLKVALQRHETLQVDFNVAKQENALLVKEIESIKERFHNSNDISETRLFVEQEKSRELSQELSRIRSSFPVAEEAQMALRKKNEKLDAELSASRLLLQNLQGELDRERGRNESLGVELATARTASRETQRELERETRRVRELEGDLAKVSEKLEEMSSRAESQSDIIRAHDRLESELNTSRTLLQNLQGELERERCRFESTSMELVSSQKMCMEARKEVETECKRNRELESELNRSSSRIEILTTRMEELQHRAQNGEELRKNNEKLDAELSASRLLLQNLQGELDRERGRNESLSVELATAQTTSRETQRELERETRRVRELEGDLAKVSDKLNRMTSRLSEMQLKVEEGECAAKEQSVLQEKVVKLEYELDLKQHELDAAHAQMKGLQRRLDDSEKTEDMLSTRFAALSRSIEDIRSNQEVTRENETIAKAEAEVRVLDIKVRTLHEQLESERRRVSDTESRLIEVSRRERGMAADHTNSIRILETRLEDTVSEVNKVCAEKRTLEDMVSDLKAQMKESELENKRLSDELASKASEESKETISCVVRLDIERERNQELEKSIQVLNSKLMDQESDYKQLRNERDQLRREGDRHQLNIDALQQDLNRERDLCVVLSDENAALKDAIKDLKCRIMKLNDLIVALKGSIRVFCRVRPIFDEERDRCNITQRDVDTLIQYPDYNMLNFNDFPFEFDRVFGPSNTQEDIFEEVEPFVRSAMGGCRVCIFAYGQTSSGKTYTMEGPEGNRGVNLRALETVMELCHTSEDYQTTVTVSMLEVYNEKIRDLLSDGARGAELEVRMGKNGTYVDNLSEWPIESVEDALTHFTRGQSIRQVASNNVNEHSSRSHLVILVKIDRRHKRTTENVSGYLYLVDLAGSERIKQTAATGQRLKEAQNINKSLSSLGDVIAALAAGQKHVPYRNSKLTFLLQDALKESSKVLMFVNINPTPGYAGESTCSLQFASRCRSVQLGQAKKSISYQAK